MIWAFGTQVAPYTGAWIEIEIAEGSDIWDDVAPYTGAWIEIRNGNVTTVDGFGRTLHGCVD